MKFATRVKELMATSATSTSTITLLGPVAGFRSVAKAIAGNALTAGDTGVCFMVEDNAGNWEEGMYTLTSATQLTRTSVTASSNDGAAVTFPNTSTKTVFNTVPGSFLASLLSTADGITPAQLAALSSVSASTKLLGLDANNGVVTVAAGLLPGGTGGGPGDTTVPTMNGSLTSANVSATAATLNWSAASDAVGVTGYEVSKDGGTTYTALGVVLSYTYTGLTASTVYAMRVRAFDAAGNKAAPLSLSVTTAAASGDTTAPNLAGSLTTTNVTATGYTMNWQAATDNVAVTGYETSTDGGTTFSDAGNVTSRAITGATASTTYNLRVRAYDAAGNRSNVLSASVTTNAAAAGMDTKYAMYNTDGKGGAAAVVYPAPGNISTNGYYAADVSLYVRTPAGTAALAAEVVQVAWSKRSGGVPVKPDLATYTQNGQKRALTRLGGWGDGDTPNSNGYYGLYSTNGNGSLFIWSATGGTFDLWLFYSDGSAEPYDNGTGTPVGLVLT
jgi:chitodextrinase